MRELGSKNGASFGDKPLPAGKETVWPRGEALVIGKNRLTFADPVGEALGDLERSADEHLSDDESIDPPRAAEPSDAAPDGASPEESAPLGSLAVQSSQKSAPIEAVPTRTPRAASNRAWGLTDVVIALVALAVLAASVVGLMWLFRTE